MLARRSPGIFSSWPITSNSPSMLLSWVPPRWMPEPGPERRGEPGGVAVGVDDGDVRGAGDAAVGVPRVRGSQGVRTGVERRRSGEPGQHGGDDRSASRGRRRRDHLAAADCLRAVARARSAGTHRDRRRAGGRARARPRRDRHSPVRALRRALPCRGARVRRRCGGRPRHAAGRRRGSRAGRPGRGSRRRRLGRARSPAAIRSLHASRPKRSCASTRPASSPGTATEPSPTW